MGDIYTKKNKDPYSYSLPHLLRIHRKTLTQVQRDEVYYSRWIRLYLLYIYHVLSSGDFDCCSPFVSHDDQG